jgi:hypothetical protein
MKLVVTLLALAALAHAGPDPSTVAIQSISYAGTACPQGSVAIKLDEARTTFSLLFDSFVAITGPTIADASSRKNCQLNINVKYPTEYSFGVPHIRTQGYVQLPIGAVAEQKHIVYFAGSTAQTSFGIKHTGPVSRDVVYDDTASLAAQVWSQCGRNVPVNINTQIRITPRMNETGQIDLSSMTGSIAYGFAWKKC